MKTQRLRDESVVLVWQELKALSKKQKQINVESTTVMCNGMGNDVVYSDLGEFKKSMGRVNSKTRKLITSPGDKVLIESSTTVGTNLLQDCLMRKKV